MQACICCGGENHARFTAFLIRRSFLVYRRRCVLSRLVYIVKPKNPHVKYSVHGLHLQ